MISFDGIADDMKNPLSWRFGRLSNSLKAWELSGGNGGVRGGYLRNDTHNYADMSAAFSHTVQKLTDKINRVAREKPDGINVVHAFNAGGLSERVV